MGWMVLACKPTFSHLIPPLSADLVSYNGTSDLQLERMNVYFNEVRC